MSSSDLRGSAVRISGRRKYLYSWWKHVGVGWIWVYEEEEEEGRRRRSLFRIVHARGAIPNEVGTAHCRAKKALARRGRRSDQDKEEDFLEEGFVGGFFFGGRVRRRMGFLRIPIILRSGCARLRVRVCCVVLFIVTIYCSWIRSLPASCGRKRRNDSRSHSRPQQRATRRNPPPPRTNASTAGHAGTHPPAALFQETPLPPVALPPTVETSALRACRSQ